MAEVGKSRRYRSELRQEQAAQTRLRIAAAGRAAFVEHGWAATSLRAVAIAAGVSEATVYAVYGNKAGLAISLIDSADADASVAQTMAELAATEGDPAAQLAAFVRFERRLFELGGDALRVIVEGRRQEPALEAAYVEGRGRGDQTRRSVFERWPASAWRSGVTVESALDAFSFTVSIESYDAATKERGWRPEQVEDWWIRTLTEALLNPQP